jgi:cell division protein FtsQ
MPAVIRAGSKGGKRGPVKGGARKAAAQAAYAPSKLRGAGSIGLDHRAALWAAMGLLCLVLLLTVFTGGRLQILGGAVGHGIDNQFARLGFKIKSVTVQGGSGFSTPYVLKAAGLTEGDPILGLNLEDVRERVEQVGWIKSAKVVRLLPDTLVIAVNERPRLAVWQHGGLNSVVDKDGQIIPEADAGQFADLPLIVGEGANEAAAAILPEITARPSLMSRLEGLVRVDGRRWDLRLKDGGVIQLPATREDSALIQFDQLEQKSRLLESGFARVDLRDPEMIAVRPRETATASRLALAAPAGQALAPSNL